MSAEFFKKIEEIKKANDKIFNYATNKSETKNNIIFVYTPPKVGSTSLEFHYLIHLVLFIFMMK